MNEAKSIIELVTFVGELLIVKFASNDGLSGFWLQVGASRIVLGLHELES